MKEGTIRLNGKEYSATVIGGKRYVNGMPIDEFLSTLSFDEQLELAMLGARLSTLKTTPQTFIDAVDKSKESN